MLATTQREVRNINNIQSVIKTIYPALNQEKTLGTILLKEASHDLVNKIPLAPRVPKLLNKVQ